MKKDNYTITNDGDKRILTIKSRELPCDGFRRFREEHPELIVTKINPTCQKTITDNGIREYTYTFELGDNYPSQSIKQELHYSMTADGSSYKGIINKFKEHDFYRRRGYCSFQPIRAITTPFYVFGKYMRMPRFM